MRTLHIGLRVADPSASLAFYSALGYEVVGEVAGTPLGDLIMLKLPDDDFVSIELVHDPAALSTHGASRLSHLVIHVDAMADTVTQLASRGVIAEPPTPPDGTADFLTSNVVDPDGNRIELVQWPAGHADGFTAADLQE
jgi:lactoylglutathione lyase